jgi:nucleotide-binding universal stress UspA family protein
MFKTILWATDGSANADRALPYARELAETSGAKLVVAHCRELLTGRAGGLPVNADEPDLIGKIRSQVAELHAAGIDAHDQIVTTTGLGAPTVIAGIAKDVDADLIVVGTRGHSALVGLLVGSVTQRLLHIAPCPVLAVPAAEHAVAESPLATTSVAS